MNYMRDCNVSEGLRAGYTQFRVLGGIEDCPGCNALDKAIIDANHARNVQPNSCVREACALAVMPYKDYLADIS